MLHIALYETTKSQFLKARGMCVVADVHYHCKMTSVLALDGVTSF